MFQQRAAMTGFEGAFKGVPYLSKIYIVIDEQSSFL